MMFLLGRQATFGHAPPTYFRSIEAVRLPSLAMVHAINLPPVPLPSTRTSYFSGSLVPLIASLKLVVERVRSGIPVSDDFSSGARAAEVAVLIGLTETSGDADRFAGDPSTVR